MPLSPHYHGPTPSDLGKGSWGSVAPYRCNDCGEAIWREPETITLSRPTLSEPGEYAYQCPNCDGLNVTETEKHARVMKGLRRAIHRLATAA